MMRTSEKTQQMKGCPHTPNCVCSLSDKNDTHYIDPITTSQKDSNSWQQFKSCLYTLPRITITQEKPYSIKAEVRSFLFRFIDDVEFIFVPEQHLIHVRSASRTGYSDFGVNRSRIEQLRKTFQDYQPGFLS